MRAKEDLPDSRELLADLRELIEARSRVAQAVYSALVLLYWQVGHRIHRGRTLLMLALVSIAGGLSWFLVNPIGRDPGPHRVAEITASEPMMNNWPVARLNAISIAARTLVDPGRRRRARSDADRNLASFPPASRAVPVASQRQGHDFFVAHLADGVHIIALTPEIRSCWSDIPRRDASRHPGDAGRTPRAG